MPKVLALAACLAGLYLSFLTASHYWDGVLFSLDIEKVAEGSLPYSTLLHPNHLLYSLLGYGIYGLLHALGFNLRSITVLQIINVLASVLCSALLFRVATRLLRSRDLAWSCTLLFVCGATWWKFSTDADSYVVSVLFLFAGVGCVLGSRPRLVLAGVCLSVAMLFHQLAIFGYVPILISLWLERNSARERFQRLAAFILLTGGCVAAVYYLAYIASHHGLSTQSFVGWITSVSKDTKTTQSVAQLIFSNASSYLKLFGGGRLSLIREFLSVPVVVTLLFAIVCAIAAFSIAFRAKGSAQTSLPRVDEPSRKVLWSWIGIYFVFLSWFEPGNAFYKLFVWPAIVLLIGSYLDRRGSASRRAFRWFALGLASWNFGAFIYPHSHIEADPVLSLAKRIDKELPKSATVYYKALSPDDWYLEYFAPGRRWEPLPLAAADIHRSTPESPVCFETTALPYVQAEIDPSLRWSLANSQHNIRFECAKRTRN